MRGKWFSYIRTLLQDADSSLSTVTDDSIMAHVLSKNGDVSNYDDTTDSLEALSESSAQLIEYTNHTAAIFPEATNLDCVLTAHANANTWSTWTEIVDTTGTPVTLSSKFASNVGHITGMLVEDTSQADTRFMAEIAHSGSKTIVSRHRILTETNKLSTAQIAKVRGAEIPAGETIYYRLMCETAGSKTVTVHFRYFLHS